MNIKVAYSPKVVETGVIQLKDRATGQYKVERGDCTSFYYADRNGNIWANDRPDWKKYVVDVKVEDWTFSKEPRRKLGKYKLEDNSAQGTLDLRHGEKTEYNLNITTAVSVEAAYELYERIRLGNILPYVSYQEEQSSQEPKIEPATTPVTQNESGLLEMYRRLLTKQGRDRVERWRR